MRAEGIADARRYGRALVHRCGIRDGSQICPYRYAKKLGIRVVVGPLDGAAAQLVKNGDEIYILCSDRVRDERKRNFDIMHECGHLVCKHPSCNPRELCVPTAPGPAHVRSYEGEASAYAGEALTPEKLVRPMCEVSPVSLDVAWRITRAFPVSILAAAIRFAELSSERVAAVFAHKGRIKWVAPSPTFTRTIERGARLHPDSVAYDFHARRKIDDRAQLIGAHAWFDTSKSVDIVEHTIASDEHGTTLTMLWVPETSAGSLGMVHR